MITPWEVLPLKGKYYGTEVSVGTAVIKIWGDRSWKLSPREIDRSKPDDEYTSNDIMSDGHYEDMNDYEIANLIASAPELLEALKDLETWWRKRNDERTIEAIEPVMIKALDAIAKAEGRS